MNQDELNVILQKHKDWLDWSEGGKRADLRHADLRYADLQCANLRGADLRYADLQGANLQGADLRSADLRNADLQRADLRNADLQWANLRNADLEFASLRNADLRNADLRKADLRGADMDYSCLPLWCGSKGMIVDRRIAAQIAAHFCALVCDDADYQAARTAILEFASTSHRAMDLGLLGEIVKECNDVATPIDVALRKRIAELETERRWIPVSERMPDDWESVLTFDISKSTRGAVTAFYNPETSLWSTHVSCDLWVTHWMPLPEPPIVYGKVCEE